MTKEELKKEFEKYLKDSSDYYDPREPLTERKLLQMWLDCAEPREKRIAELEREIKRLEKELAFTDHDREHNYYEWLDCNKKVEELEKENAELKEENKKSNVLIVDIIEAFDSRSYNDDFEMAQAGKEIYELFYGGKDPKEVFHNAEVPKSSRQLLVEAKEIIRKCMGQMSFHDCEYTDAYKMAEAFLKECEK